MDSWNTSVSSILAHSLAAFSLISTAPICSLGNTIFKALRFNPMFAPRSKQEAIAPLGRQFGQPSLFWRLALLCLGCVGYRRCRILLPKMLLALSHRPSFCCSSRHLYFISAISQSSAWSMSCTSISLRINGIVFSGTKLLCALKLFVLIQ